MAVKYFLHLKYQNLVSINFSSRVYKSVFVAGGSGWADASSTS